jgi:hypothetical protein
MNVNVVVNTGINIQVTPQVSPVYAISNVVSGLGVQVTPPASPIYVISNVPVGGSGVSEAWVNTYYYPRSNPSGFITNEALSGLDFGALASGQVTGDFVLAGTGNVYIVTGANNVIYISGDTRSFVTTGQLLRFSTTLNSGVESQSISYPTALAQRPSALVCEIENNVDNLIYSHALNSVTSSGFVISFSDILSTTGYTLYTTVGT